MDLSLFTYKKIPLIKKHYTTYRKVKLTGIIHKVYRLAGPVSAPQINRGAQIIISMLIEYLEM